MRHYASKERKGVKEEAEIWKFVHSTFEFSGSIGSVPAGTLVICRRGGKDELFGEYGDGTFSTKDKELKVVEVSEKTIVPNFSGLVVPKPAQRPAFSTPQSTDSPAKDTTSKVVSKRSVSAEADEENKDRKSQNEPKPNESKSKSSISNIPSGVSSVPVAQRSVAQRSVAQAAQRWGEFCEKRKCEFSVSYDVCEEDDIPSGNLPKEVTPASAFNPALTISRDTPGGAGVGFIREFGGAIIVGAEGYVQQFVNVSFEHQKTVLFVNFDKQKLSFYDSEYFKRYSVYGYVDLKKI